MWKLIFRLEDEGGSSTLEKATVEEIPDYNPELAGILLSGAPKPASKDKSKTVSDSQNHLNEDKVVSVRP